VKHGITLPGGGRIVYGVEFDGIGQRVAYWLFPEHPGNSAWPTVASQRIPAESVLHIFKPTRPGAIRGASWFAPVLLRFKDFDEYEDATLMKQKIAACLAVFTSDVDGDARSARDR
jgi:capsid protein